MANLFSRFLRWSAILPTSTLLLTLSLPPRPAAALNQFDVCVNDLIGSGIPGEQAGTACSDALIPKELSQCVSIIKNNTPVPPEDALKACYQVRRPVDLGNCVADIYNATLKSYVSPTANKEVDSSEITITKEESPTLGALDSCRRSLLPARHSECVIALSRDVQNTTPVKAMEICLSAEDFPRDIFPSYTD
jgi:hypothetical protein